ncbi:hypothetical protein A2U01_0087624, partial [Trifolium medium]|nr:hypothetical protein [Trifolium medium]
ESCARRRSISVFNISFLSPARGAGRDARGIDA